MQRGVAVSQKAYAELEKLFGPSGMLKQMEAAELSNDKPLRCKKTLRGKISASNGKSKNSSPVKKRKHAREEESSSESSSSESSSSESSMTDEEEEEEDDGF